MTRSGGLMELENSFVVPADLATTWLTLLDVRAIAPCVLGATLTSVDGECFGAEIRVKLGPVTLAYQGQAVVVSQDEADHCAVIEGTGREAKGNGTARALITLRLVAEAATRTRVDVGTHLDVTGKAAQFGQSVLVDVSRRVVDQFAGNLALLVAERSRTTGAPTAGSPSSVGSLSA